MKRLFLWNEFCLFADMKTILTSILLLIINLAIAQTEFPFAKFTQFSTETVDLTKGEYLVGIFNTNCDHCQDAATGLRKLDNNNVPKMYALFYNEIEEIGPKEFSAKTNTNYPFIVIGDDDFWTLLKNNPPIIYHIKESKIIQWYDGENIAERIDSSF